jgi:hypothetical protein
LNEKRILLSLDSKNGLKKRKGIMFQLWIESIVRGINVSEKKLFYIDCEEEEDQELELLQDLELEETPPTIS